MNDRRQRRWLREPLVHFLLAGGALFLLVSWLDPAPDAEDVITVTPDDLLATMQGRAQVYDRATFEALLAQMEPDQRRALIRETVLDEALFREGRKLSLAEIDPVVRQRIVQQMRILLLDDAAADLAVSEEEARTYFAEHRADYRQSPATSFTHVFFSADKHGVGAEPMARTALARLNADKVPADRAGQFGDRFLYQTNYASAGAEQIGAEFGDGFAAQVLGQSADGEWRGPVQSTYGWHLVLVTKAEPARDLTYDEVAQRVRDDALAAKRQTLLDDVMDKVLTRYDIRLEGGLASE